MGPSTPPPPSEAVEIAYEFALTPEPDLAVQVSLTFRPKLEELLTTLACDEWAGIHDCERDVHQLAVKDGAGHALPWEHPERNRWTVRHSPGQALIVSYVVLPTSDEADTGRNRNEYFRPILKEDLFHLIGKLGLLYPESLSNQEARRIGVRWKGFQEAHWQVACSFSNDQNGFRITKTLEDFRTAVFVAGQMHTYTWTVSGGTVHMALFGDGWGFTDGEFINISTRIINAERAFTSDFTLPYYFISVVPVKTQEADGWKFSAGTALSSSFVLFLKPGTVLTAEDVARHLKYLIAHETFHTWNGNAITYGGQERLLTTWFSEGFTDFYTRRLLYRSGLYTLDDYTNDLNDTLQSYMLSPVRSEPNERIEKGYWSDPYINKLPYHRGDLVALLVDHEIRKRHKGAKSLDDLMKSLFSRVKNGETFSTEKILTSIALFTSPEFVTQLRKVIVGGGLAKIEPDVLEPCLALKRKMIRPFKLGFDFEQTQRAHVLSNVEKNSNAFRAGLRNGQSIKTWTVPWGHVDMPVELTLMDPTGADRVVRYIAAGAPMSVVQFVPRDTGALRCQAVLLERAWSPLSRSVRPHSFRVNGLVRADRKYRLGCADGHWFNVL